MKTKEYGPTHYAVEYMLRGETKWRRTMWHQKDMLGLQESVLWENRAMEKTRIVAVREETIVISERTK